VLQADRASLERVITVTIHLADMSNFPKIVQLCERWGKP